MRKNAIELVRLKWSAVLILVVGFSYPSVSRSSQGGAAAPMATVSTTVSIEAKHGKEMPVIYKEDVRVFRDHERLRVVDWVPCQSDQTSVELFVLIDDASSTELGLQLGDLQKFMDGQPASNTIALGYIRNGTVDVRQNFTRDHALAAKALRLPLGTAGAVASPYTAISELIQHWPSSSNCREVFMVSSGIDGLEPGPTDPYLDEAIEQAQRAGVQVYSIYASAAGHIGHSFWRFTQGQSNLSRLADETGGEAYFQALEMPVSYGPYLKEFADRLSHQHRLTFVIPTRDRAGLQKIRLETEVPDAELVTAERVYVPAPAK